MKTHECIEAKKERQRENLRKWRRDNADKRKLQRQREYQNSKDKLKTYAMEYRGKNPETTKAAQAKWRAENKEYINRKAREKYAEDSSKKRLDNSIRHKRLRQSTPKWANKTAIKAKFVEAQKLSDQKGVLHHVDHIYPLNGRLVSGLTVPDNLQVLTESENCRKSNLV